MVFTSKFKRQLLIYSIQYSILTITAADNKRNIKTLNRSNPKSKQPITLKSLRLAVAASAPAFVWNLAAHLSHLAAPPRSFGCRLITQAICMFTSKAVTRIFFEFFGSGNNGFCPLFPFFNNTSDFLTASLAISMCFCWCWLRYSWFKWQSCIILIIYVFRNCILSLWDTTGYVNQ